MTVKKDANYPDLATKRPCFTELNEINSIYKY